MTTPVPSPDLRQRRNQSQGVSYPASDDEDEGFVKRNYGVNNYRGLSQTVVGIRQKVEKERGEAKAAQEKLKLDMQEQDLAAKVVHKELSVQLRVAGRSYDQLLVGMRELNDQLREAEERRIAEVEPLQRDIKRLKHQLSIVEEPWKKQVQQLSANILKLQEKIGPLEQECRDEKLKMEPVVAKLKNEILLREEATEAVLKEVAYWEEHVAEITRQGDERFHAEKSRSEAEIRPLRDEIQRLKDENRTVVEPYKKEIKELKFSVDSLKHDLSMVDYEPYKRQIALNALQYSNLSRDFQTKDAYNRENLEKMRATYEQLAERMNKKMTDLMRENDIVVKPYKEEIERKDVVIQNLEAKAAAMRDAAARHRDEFAALKSQLDEELKVAYTAIDKTHEELVKVQESGKQREMELNENDPMKQVYMLELKLEEVTRKCEVMHKIKDDELQEKAEIINRLHGVLKEKANLLHDLDQDWNQRIVKKEEGYLAIAGELSFAEGQIIEERKTIALKEHEVYMREQEILALKGMHTEELKFRQQAQEESERKLREVENQMTFEGEALAEQNRKLEEEVLMWRMRGEADITDARVDVERMAQAKKKVEGELEALRAEYHNARSSFEEKLIAMDVNLRNRDRTIMQQKNELEIISDSWEIKYNTLRCAFEKQQKRYDEATGPNGILEATRRNKDLKQEIVVLAGVIGDLREQIKKLKRRNRDLELTIDETLKETSDLIREKDKGISNMVGDYAKLRGLYDQLTDSMKQLQKEKDGELVIVVESYQARVVELEQLVESLRFTDRQVIFDKIAVWKKAYERVVLERDMLDEEHAHSLNIKEKQLDEIVKELNEEKDAAFEKQRIIDEQNAARDKSWQAKELVWRQDQRKLDAEILRLRNSLDVAEMRAKQKNAFVDEKREDPEVQRMRQDLIEKEQQIDAMTKGIQLMSAENEELTKATQVKAVSTDAVHESYKPILAEKDKTIKRMEREYAEMKHVLEIEWYKAQQACRAIEERVKKFPNPFEIEVREMRDKFAQMQAGMLTLSHDNIKQQDQLDKIKDARVREVKHLEVQLQQAVSILKDVSSIGVLQGMSGKRFRELEEALGMDHHRGGDVT
jgi:hypothetical protein